MEVSCYNSFTGRVVDVTPTTLSFCPKIALNSHSTFIVGVLFLCQNLTMQQINIYAIPIKDSESNGIVWVMNEPLIFKAVIKDVHTEEPKSSEQASR